ncbi:ATP-binding cassette domain-containing protein [Sulfurospirillum diekertiae]|uniref:ATP-binding cassette domain-containing protein n=1 Tax=Sulfurospirillum diekertiae TaxID=1854492 RepID=A0A6G9VPX8_9BACT|nr:ATP-binding cassette domain-containing protein [Sulfurospirillum diekertiae]QIR74776.1 ATP-binding cassette domain-containing protein [Sulfurospirillum diekertiae]QIR77440.1 ATP-binding cassette domain-containing protein [Sulfurospirillum diekertiae]
MSQEVLRIENLSFAYPNSKLLYDNFSLHVKVGEVVAILGASGSGKSTLFELIAGNLKANSGTIHVMKLSQIFQDPYTSFHPTYTIVNQISDVAPLHDLHQLCDALDLDTEVLAQKPHQLSGGQLQRCSILRALLMKPSLILADEPTSALDNITGLHVMQLLMQFLDRIGILLITHDKDLASWCSDRMIELKEKK